jgi:hypothetical protein
MYPGVRWNAKLAAVSGLNRQCGFAVEHGHSHPGEWKFPKRLAGQIQAVLDVGDVAGAAKLGNVDGLLQIRPACILRPARLLKSARS